MKKKIALALCVHHKPYLIMSTLVTVLMQDLEDFDIHLLFNVGDGQCEGKDGYGEYREYSTTKDAGSIIAQSVEIEKKSYGEYDEMARKAGINPKLSPFDERLRQVCALRRPNVFVTEFENDQSLDSGAWLKFIRSGAWKGYDYVFMIQEGTLLPSRHSLSAAVAMAAKEGIHFLASAHMKGRLPKERMLNFHASHGGLYPADRLHDEMIRKAFGVFCRDLEFKAAFDEWRDDFSPTRQLHVRDLKKNILCRLRAAADKSQPFPRHPVKRRLAQFLRRFPMDLMKMECRIARLAAFAGRFLPALRNPPRDLANENIYVNGAKTRLLKVVEVKSIKDVCFHKENGVEWFGCHINHMFSREFLEKLSNHLEKNRIYDALDLPFSGSALEVAWGLFPRWLGYDKWFFDGTHRISKDAGSSQRVDTPEGLSAHLNRYFLGEIAVEPNGDFINIKSLSRGFRFLQGILDPCYFGKPLETS